MFFLFSENIFDVVVGGLWMLNDQNVCNKHDTRHESCDSYWKEFRFLAVNHVLTLHFVEQNMAAVQNLEYRVNVHNQIH